MSTCLLYLCIKYDHKFLIPPAIFIGIGLDLILAYFLAQVLK
jgi:hypothetical protein